MGFLSLVSKSAVASSDDFIHCEITVGKWAEASSDNGINEDKLNLKDLLFFLHVPRTGGRTYFHWYAFSIANVQTEVTTSLAKMHLFIKFTN